MLPLSFKPMKKIFLFLLVFVLSYTIIRAQNITINGQVFDASNQSIVGANVVLLQPADSAIIKGVTTDVNGNFKIETDPSAKLLIRISYIGYQDVFISKFSPKRFVNLGKITLQDKSTTLTEVNIVGLATPVLQIGDTTQINATSFKTNPDANAEDLVTKMPGITIQDGKVQAHGETVQKVTVDGREFFGDDASAVLKNLPAEVVDKIQIFDKKSEQSEVTGFDDGTTSKTINVVTKVQFRNGIFGKAYGGYGYDDKWKSGLNLNFFKDKRRFTILASSNNINDQNFSSEDLLGVMSSGGGGSSRRGGGRSGGQSGGDAGNFLVDQKSGVTATNSFGLNYADQFGKVNFNGSYFLNYSDNNSVNDLFRQYITTQNEGLTYNESQKNNSTNINHRLNFKIEWKIDSMNSILIQPKLSLQQNDASSLLLGGNNRFSSPISQTENDFSSNLTGINISLPILYRHSFVKKGRTFSVNLNPNYNQNNGDNYLRSTTQFFNDTLTSDELNQMANRYIQGITFSSNIAFTEPLSDKSQLMITYGTNYTKSESNRKTFNYSTLDANYNLFDTTLSNNYNSEYFSQTIGTNLRYRLEKWNFSAGLSYQYAQLYGTQIFPDEFNLNKTFNSVLPNAQFQYKFSNKKNLRVSYRSSNKAPSINQLQNVINNNNPLLLSTGNPDLKQNWQNSLVFRYSSSSTEKSKSFMSLISGTITKNYIVNSTFIASADTLITPGITLARGSQLSRPINLDNYINIRSFNNYSFPVKFLKSNLNLNLGGLFSRTPGMVNDELNYSNNLNVGFGIALSSNISEKVDFTISSNTTYNNISNSLQTGLNSIYYNQNSIFKIQVMPWKWLVLQTDINHQYNSGLSDNYNKNYYLWNAAIGYKFLKNRLAELRLSVFDIMKQNNSISRNTTETYYEDIQTNVLQQYFLLTFTYNLKYFKETKTKKQER